MQNHEIRTVHGSQRTIAKYIRTLMEERRNLFDIQIKRNGLSYTALISTERATHL